MRKKYILLGAITLCVILSACNSKNIMESNKNNAVNELELETPKNESDDGEVVKNKEDMPVMSEESIQCIETALGDYSKQGKGIAEFLRNVSKEKIVQAEMVEGELYGFTKFLEVENESGEVYIVVMSPEYYADSIIKDSLEGKWIFGVTE